MNYTVAEAWIFRDELKREREKGWRRKKDVGRGVGVWYRGRIFCTRRCAAFTVLISRTKWLTRDLTGIDNYGLFHSLSCTPPPHPPSLSLVPFFLSFDFLPICSARVNGGFAIHQAAIQRRSQIYATLTMKEEPTPALISMFSVPDMAWSQCIICNTKNIMHLFPVAIEHNS